MQYKIENDELIPAPVNYVTPDGKTICNFNLSVELMNQYGFTMTEEEAEEWRKDHPEPKPPVTLDQLTELTYQAKAAVAYGGLTFVKDGVSYQFDTDVDSITMCNAQVLLMINQLDDYQIGWKVYVNDHPTLLPMTKAEFIKVYGFGNLMVNSAFVTEGTLNAHYEALTEEELQALDLDTERAYIQSEFDKIPRVYEV